MQESNAKEINHSRWNASFFFFVIAKEIELAKLAWENAISMVTAHHPNLIA